jgi:hypothetical protein
MSEVIRLLQKSRRRSSVSSQLVNYNPTPRAVPKDNMRFSLPYCSPLVDKTFVVVPIPVDQQLKEHKGKYEQAKTELRNVKGKNNDY